MDNDNRRFRYKYSFRVTINMRQRTQNTFSGGMIMDLNPLSTPRDVLVDCLNGTIITYNGTEFVLQNDQGNCQVDSAQLSPGFIPMGMKEYGGIVYVASLNPQTGMCEIGSFPFPQEDFSTTDYGEIGPVNFITANFIVDTGDDSVATITDKNSNLFQPELLQLSPGDLYVVTYTITDPNSANDALPDNINNTTKYNNWISQDPTNRKLFRLTFSKITSNNTLTALPFGVINIIPYQSDLSSSYTYYPEPSQTTLTVGLELETLDTFNVFVEDISLNTNSDKQISIVATGSSASLSTFNGVRVIVTQPSSQTFFLDNTANSPNAEVSAIVDGLTENQNFQCSITPYSPYCLYPNLTKTFNLTIGKYLSSGSGVNNIFTYYVDTVNNAITLNFDWKFQGNSPNGLFLYIEFYDPWSDYSVVQTVDNPSFYGLNSVILPLVTEPYISQFDSTTTGGTLPSLLITNPDTIYAKTMLNSTNQIRINQALRLNGFYIVRISGVDTAYSGGTYTYTHYDLYKGLYTTDMFNSVYNNQVSLAVSDPSYVSDFNSLDFVIGNINYSSTIALNNTLNIAPIVTQQRTDLMTNGNYYIVSPTSLSTTPGYKYTQTYETQNTYAVNLTLQGLSYIFGTFKTSLLTITPPTLVASNSMSSGEKPTIIDVNYNSDTNIEPNSVASWTLINTSGTNYLLNTDTVTSRSVYSPVATLSGSPTGITYQEIPLAGSFSYRPNGDSIWITTAGPAAGAASGTLASPNATLLIQKEELQCMGKDGTQYIYTLGSDHPYDGNVVTAINTAINSTTYGDDGRTYSAVLMTSCEPTWGYGSVSGPTYNSCNDHGTSQWKNTTLVVNMADGTYRLTKVTDIKAMEDFFNSLYVTSSVSNTVYVYYPNASVESNDDIQTNVTYPDLIFTTNFTPTIVSMAYVNTYLSTFNFQALSEPTADFSTTNINSYIATRQGSSTIVDGSNTIRDGFIPFINTLQTTTSNVAVPNLTIDQTADSAIITSFLAGQNQYLSDPKYRENGAGVHTHGTLWSNIPDYQTQYVPLLQVKPTPVTNTPIVNTGTSAAYVQIIGSTPIWNYGKFYRVGGCSNGVTAPSLIPSFDVTTQ